MRSILTAILLLTPAIAAAAPAPPAASAGLRPVAPLPATPVRPPASLDEKGVTAWIRQALKTEGWTVISADQQAVTLGSPAGVAMLGDGNLRTQIRHEYYAATRIGPIESRSNLQTWNVDCAKRKLQVVAMQVFPRNNLAGPGVGQANPAAPWRDAPAGSQNARALDRICAAPRTGTRR